MHTKISKRKKNVKIRSRATLYKLLDLLSAAEQELEDFDKYGSSSA